MPCYDSRSDDHEKCQAKEIVELRKRNDELARLLCAAGKAYYSDRSTPHLSVRRWWKAHREFDKNRGE